MNDTPKDSEKKSQNVSDIYLEYKNPLKGFIFKQKLSKEDGEDILQDVFYQLSKVDLDESPIEQVSAWLYRVARNRIIDHQRKIREERIPAIAELDEDSLSLIQDMQNLDFILDSDSPEGDFYKSLIMKELEEALDELPDEQSKVFTLTEMEGFSFKEISEATGIGINTLISRKRYAVLHLRERLAMIYQDLTNI